MIPKHIVAIMLIPLAVLAGEVTLTFTPQIKFKVEKGHSYKVWRRLDLKDPWVLSSKVEKNTNQTYNMTVDYSFMPEAKTAFFWLQVDDEVLQSAIPVVGTNAVSGPPPVPGG